jgi:hypothetical protein
MQDQQRLENVYNHLLTIAEKTTKKSHLYGCNLLLNLLYPDQKESWKLIKQEYKKDIGYNLPYPLTGTFLKEFRIYLIKKVMIKMGYEC